LPSRSPAIARPSLVLPAAARAADLPASLEPELATLVDRPPGGDWIYEIKFDGYRMLARVAGARDVRLLTRRGNDWTHRFAALRRALVDARLPPGWYDGEIVLLDESGKPSFNGLQNAIEGGRNDAIVFYLFDVPFCAGHDLRRVPVEQRRALLQSLLKESERLRFSQEIGGDAASILQSACRLGLEGVIGKRRGSIYVQRRSDDWIKLKCTQRQEFVIGGFTWPDDSRPAGIGALLVGYHDDEGVLQYAGKVGTGFTGEVSAALRQRLDAMAQGKLRSPARRATTGTPHGCGPSCCARSRTTNGRKAGACGTPPSRGCARTRRRRRCSVRLLRRRPCPRQQPPPRPCCARSPTAAASSILPPASPSWTSFATTSRSRRGCCRT